MLIAGTLGEGISLHVTVYVIINENILSSFAKPIGG